MMVRGIARAEGGGGWRGVLPPLAAESKGREK
jgi:hypothetical protein